MLVASVAFLPACGTDDSNPFAAFNRVAPIPADADIVFVSNLHAGPGAFHEAFAFSRETETESRLTFCTDNDALCDTLEAVPHPDRERLAMRRVPMDLNRDGALGDEDGVSLIVAQLVQGFESPFTKVDVFVSGVTWSLPPQAVSLSDFLVYSALDPALARDLFQIDANGQNSNNLTSNPATRETRPSFDPLGRFVAYERTELEVTLTGNIDQAAPGKSGIWLFQSASTQFVVSQGGPGSAVLPGTLFIVGSDTDPVVSPDGTRIAFRRLTDTGNGGRGSWDILTTDLNGANPETVAAGPQYRGAPDWGAEGLLFVELDLAARTNQLVVVQPDGTGRSTPLTLSPDLDLSHPRWLTPAAPE
jgi:Tol biopolymer transport system component